MPNKNCSQMFLARQFCMLFMLLQCHSGPLSGELLFESVVPDDSLVSSNITCRISGKETLEKNYDYETNKARN